MASTRVGSRICEVIGETQVAQVVRLDFSGWRPRPITRSVTRLTGKTCAALLCLAATNLLAAAASAAPGLSAPIRVAARGAHCPALAGGLIGWAELAPGTPRAYLRAPIADRLATLSPQGVSAETTIDGPPGTSDCPSLAASAAGGLGIAEVISPIPEAGFLQLVEGGPLWLARPGTPARDTGFVGLLPRISLAPNGGGVVAWLHYAGIRDAERRNYEGGGPSFTVEAARLSADGALGTPETVAGPSAGDTEGDELTGPLHILPPAVYADPDGTLVVASALLASSAQGTSVVRVSESRPGLPFGPSQAVSTPRRYSAPVEAIQLVGDGAGRHLVQWQRSQEAAIEAAVQDDPAQPFRGLPPRLAPKVESRRSSRPDSR